MDSLPHPEKAPPQKSNTSSPVNQSASLRSGISIPTVELEASVNRMLTPDIVDTNTHIPEKGMAPMNTGRAGRTMFQ